jgi:hypothetical protein
MINLKMIVNVLITKGDNVDMTKLINTVIISEVISWKKLVQVT